MNSVARSKGVAVLLLIIMCFALLSACSKNDTASNEPGTEPAVASAVSPEPASSEPSTEPAAASVASVQPASSEPSTEPTASTVSAEPAKNGPLTIKYVGNSCFYLTFPDGTTILTDPYPDSYRISFGPAPDMEVDAYTVSHYHPDHVPLPKQLKGDPQKITPAMMTKPVKVGGVEITGYPSKHVAGMGDNEIFVYHFGDLKIAHMGETDRIESPEAKEAVKGADVVLTYTGGYGPETLENPVIFKSLYDMNVKVLIPQHFSNNPDAKFYGGPTIDEILKEVPQGIEKVKLDELVVTKDMKKQFVELSQMNAK